MPRVSNGEAPVWRQRFDAFVAAASAHMRKSGEFDAVAILDAAGLDQKEWYNARSRAKVAAPEEVAALCELIGKPVRGRRQKQGGAQEVAEEPAEESAAPANLGQATAEACAWLEPLAPDEQRKAYTALGILLGLTGAADVPASPLARKGGRRK